MKIPAIKGIIDRRILVNFRVDPEILARTLPPPFRPKTVRGFGMAGICLIRLKSIRPACAPAWIGIASENAAHRTAVVWNDGDAEREGVYVRRRDSDSRLNALAGGRIFPGIHHHARFDVNEAGDRYEVALRSDDGETQMSVVARREKENGDWIRIGSQISPASGSQSANSFPVPGFRAAAAHAPGFRSADSIFASLAEASAFFEAGALGYSDTPDPARFQGLELLCKTWKTEQLAVDSVASSFFEDRRFFPEGSVAFDCALLMRGIEHEWHGREDLCCEQIAGIHA